jgi:hypothetical protein
MSRIIRCSSFNSSGMKISAAFVAFRRNSPPLILVATVVMSVNKSKIVMYTYGFLFQKVWEYSIFSSYTPNSLTKAIKIFQKNASEKVIKPGVNI